MSYGTLTDSQTHLPPLPPPPPPYTEHHNHHDQQQQQQQEEQQKKQQQHHHHHHHHHHHQQQQQQQQQQQEEQQKQPQQQQQQLQHEKRQKQQPDHHSPCFQARYITGVYMLNIGGIISWIWGNFSVYTRSFMYSRLDDPAGASVPWIVPLYYIGWACGMLSQAPICKYIKRKYVLVISSILVTAAVGLSYFSLQYSVTLFNLTFGLLPGLGCGTIFSLQLIYVAEFVNKKNVGFFTSGVNASTITVSFIANELITFYINPDNAQPDRSVGQIKVFTDNDILDRVPHIFWFFTLTSVVWNVVGMLLMYQRPLPISNNSQINKHNNEQQCNTNSLPPLSNNSFDEISDLNENEKMAMMEPEQTPLLTKDVETQVVEYYETQQRDLNLTLKEALKTRTFYLLWLIGAVADTTYVTLSSYYKTFGLVEIPDDHFLTTVGTFLSVFVGVFTFISGALVDRLGVKNCLMGHLSLITLLLAWYPFTARISRWVFFFATMAYGCLSYPFYTMASIAVLTVFGNSHYTTILAMTYTSSVLINIVLPTILDSLVDNFGFYGLFFYVGSLTLIVGILIAAFFKRD